MADAINDNGADVKGSFVSQEAEPNLNLNDVVEQPVVEEE